MVVRGAWGEALSEMKENSVADNCAKQNFERV